LEDLMKQYGTDASRVALALCGDNLDDANFEHATANSAILHLSQMEVLFTELTKKRSTMRKNGEGDEKSRFLDAIFENEMNQLLLNVEQSYEQMRFRDVIKDGLFEFQHAFNAYRLNLGDEALNEHLIDTFMKFSLLMLFPVAPHFGEVLFKNVFPNEKSIREQRWPQNIKVDTKVLRQNKYIETLLRSIRLSLDKLRLHQQKKKLPV